MDKLKNFFQEKMDKLKNRYYENPIGTIALTVSFAVIIFFLFITVYQTFGGFIKMAIYPKTTGYISDCTQYKTSFTTRFRGSSTRTYYACSVSYSVDGVVYKLQGIETGKEEIKGTKVTVFYNSRNPKDAVVKEAVMRNGHRLLAPSLPFWVIVVFVGLIIGIEMLYEKRKKKRLKEEYGFEYNKEQKRAEMKDYLEKLKSVNEDSILGENKKI